MARKKMKEIDKKKKMSVTIDADINKKLDDYVSKNNINRSALIEELLKKYIENHE